MAEPRNIGVALLAAGSSRRFGDADKLAAAWRGRMLGEHAAVAFPVDKVSSAWVIVADRGHRCEQAWQARGFAPLVNDAVVRGMGSSVALAARHAQSCGLDALAIVLADMPLVPRRHFSALIDAACRPDDIAVSAIGAARMPPAVFGSAHFATLIEARADSGARAILGMGKVVECPQGWLADIDTRDELAALE